MPSELYSLAKLNGYNPILIVLDDKPNGVLPFARLSDNLVAALHHRLVD
jgi:hypothetical protein